MTVDLRPEDFTLFQQVSMELRAVQERADHARQTYIADRSGTNLQSWIEELRSERLAWDRYWKAHREYFEQLDD